MNNGQESELIIIEGNVSRITFRNDENGYSVFTLIKDNNKEERCVGSFIELHEGDRLELKGRYIEHAKYGKQFSVKTYKTVEPLSREAFFGFLKNGGIPGIREATAKKIINEFGDNAYEIMLNAPQTLAANIKGISKKKAEEYQKILQSNKNSNDLSIYVQQYGINIKTAAKIYEFYGDQAYSIIKENPYRLIEDIKNIGFKTADQIAIKTGAFENSSFRIKAAITYSLEQAAANGHTYLPKSVLYRYIGTLIQDVNTSDVDSCLEKMSTDSKVIIRYNAPETSVAGDDYDKGEEVLSPEDLFKALEEESSAEHVSSMQNISPEDIFIYLPLYYRLESSLALRLLRLDGDVDDVFDSTDIDKAEKRSGIILDELQRKAVEGAVENGLFVITGGPGTGKTTVIKNILNVFENKGFSISLAAPTGKAAKRLSESTGREASTIHRLLGFKPQGDNIDDDVNVQFEYNEQNQLETDVIIIDEMSMVDLSIMYSLIKAVNVGTRLVLVGDADQLPSVGAGNILSDIIKSECLPVVKLEKIFRQDAVSDIIANAHKINKGEYVDLSKKSQDFFFIRRERPNDIINAIYALISDKLPKYVGCDAKDIQILAPSKMTDVGVNRLNEIMQSLLNPPAENKEEIELFGKIYRVGDKVIHIKNNYNMEWKKYDGFGLSTEGTGVFNGDTGVIRGIESTVGELEVVFDDGRYVTYSKSELEQLELAYALTVHKAQGSEYPAIIMPMYNVPRMLLNRKLLYTAVTRAKKCVCLVGIEEIFNKMKDNEYELKRYSTFDKRLKEAYAEFI